MKKLLYVVFVAGILFGWTSCNNYLDEVPDNRTEVDSPDKIRKLLVSGYSENYTAIFIREFMTDNYTDNGIRYSSDRMLQESYTFADNFSSIAQDSPSAIYEGSYNGIAHANHALRAISELEDPSICDPERGEALMIRAFMHYNIASTFCNAYYSGTATQEYSGMPYSVSVEEVPHMDYKRPTLEYMYSQIANDIETAYPLEGKVLLNDNIYSQPAFHFTRRAAAAFAAEFFLMYAMHDDVNIREERLKKSVAYADLALGENPVLFLRDMKTFSDVASTDYMDSSVLWSNSDVPANFLITPSMSLLGWVMFTGVSRYGMNGDKYDMMSGEGPWSKYISGVYVSLPYRRSGYGTARNWFVPKQLYEFRYTDIAAGIGYPYTIPTPFTADKTLLYRAEAKVLLGQLEEAAADLNYWYAASGLGTYLSVAEIVQYYKDKETINLTTADVDPMDDTGQARLEIREEWGNAPIMTPPVENIFTLDDQKYMIYACLHARRTESIHEGNRILDLKRWRISFVHPIRNALETQADNIYIDQTVNADSRLTLQIPQMVISADFRPNDRSIFTNNAEVFRTPKNPNPEPEPEE